MERAQFDSATDAGECPHPGGELHRDLSDFAFPSEGVTQCPFPFYEALRRESPIFKYPDRDEFLISRRKDIMFVLQHPEIFSNATYRGDSRMVRDPRWITEPPKMPAGPISTPFAMSQSDLPEHTDKQRAARPLVARQRLEDCEEVLSRIAHELIDGFIARGEVELRGEFADPLALFTICELAGFAPEDRPIYMSWNRIGTGHGRRYLTEEQLAAADSDKPDQVKYCERIILDRYEHPREDFLTEFIQGQVERDGALNLPYLTSEVNLILVAGNETTSRMLTSTMLLLLRHPEQLERLLADRSLVPSAVEESLRYESPTQWVSRYCIADTEIDGKPIPAGSFVMLLYGSANRDETWEEPDAFQIDRSNVRKYHMAFGGGIHRCLGAPIARLEGRLALEILLDRLKNPRLASGHDDELANIDNFQKRVPKALHIEFDPA
jgi:cytochrome P450